MKKSTIIFSSIVLVLFVWHLWSLKYLPLPWFDEVVFSSITHSLINGDGFLCDAYTGEQLYTYGPVYFFLTAIPTSLFGFGVISFRITNFLFTFLCMFPLWGIMRKRNVSKNIAYVCLIFYLTSFIITQNMHMGRMEMVCLFFALSSYWIYYKFEGDIPPAWTLLFGLCISLAVLTTPRVAAILIPLGFAILYQIMKKKQWVQFLLLSISVLGPYLVWIYASYGGVSEMFSSLTQPVNYGVQNKGSALSQFVGGNFVINFWDWAMILTSIFLVIASFYQKKWNCFVLPFSSIITYYLLVYDTGIYSTFIIPFFTIIIAFGFSIISKKTVLKRITFACLGLCFFVNLGMFSVRIASVVSSYDMRNPQPISEWIGTKVPAGSRLVGDFRFFYACMDNNIRFRTNYKENYPSKLWWEELKTDFQPQYVMLSGENCDDMAELNGLVLEKVAKYESINHDSALRRLVKRFVPSNDTFDGVLYKIIGEKKTNNI